MNARFLKALLLATLCACNFATADAGVKGGRFGGTVNAVIGGVPDAPDHLDISVDFLADGASVWDLNVPGFPDVNEVAADAFSETDFILFSIWTCQLDEYTQASGFSLLSFVTTIQVDNNLDWEYHLDGFLFRTGSSE